VGVVALPTRLHLSFAPLADATEIRAVLGVAGLAVCGVAFALIRKGLSPYALVYAVAALAMVLGPIL
jgi:hypothetical protein